MDFYSYKFHLLFNHAGKGHVPAALDHMDPAAGYDERLGQNQGVDEARALPVKKKRQDLYRTIALGVICASALLYGVLIFAFTT